MVTEKPEIAEENKPPNRYQYTKFYNSITDKWNDLRVRKDIADELKRLGRSGIASWKILETVLKVVNKHPTIRNEIVNEIEERY